MLTDRLNTFTLEGEVGAVGTRIIGDVIDLGSQPGDAGVGNPVYLYANVQTAIAGATDSTIRFQLVTADNAALDSGPVVLAETEVLDAAAGVAAGTVLFNQALPSTSYKRYLGFREVVAAANTSAGEVNAFLTEDQIAYRHYKEGAN